MAFLRQLGGVAVTEILNILENFDLKKMGPNSPVSST